MNSSAIKKLLIPCFIFLSGCTSFLTDGNKRVLPSNNNLGSIGYWSSPNPARLSNVLDAMISDCKAFGGLDENSIKEAEGASEKNKYWIYGCFNYTTKVNSEIENFLIANGKSKLPACTDNNIAKYNCYGSVKYGEDVYVGNFKNGVRHGYGEYTFKSGNKYMGIWVDGKAPSTIVVLYDGKSKWTGSYYIGSFLNDKKNGYGVHKSWNGDKYEGQFKNDQLGGLAIFTPLNGLKQEGFWESGVIVRREPVNLDSIRDRSKVSPVINIEDSKKKCSDLGFKSGTEAFGNCVLKLTK
jgi:hypothetical protein